MCLLLEGIEHYSCSDATEPLAHLYMKLLLALNLQHWTRHAPATQPAHATNNNDDSRLRKDPTTVEEETLLEAKPLPLPSAVEAEVAKPRPLPSAVEAELDSSTTTNVVLQQLAQRESTTYFAEKLLLLFNREGESL